MLNFNYALKLSKQSAYTSSSACKQMLEVWDVCFVFLSLEASAWHGIRELPSV